LIDPRSSAGFGRRNMPHFVAGKQPTLLLPVIAAA
jgi:hypothetical protein